MHQVFCLDGTISVKLFESRNPVKIPHVTDILNFDDEDEKIVDIFYIMVKKIMVSFSLKLF